MTAAPSVDWSEVILGLLSGTDASNTATSALTLKSASEISAATGDSGHVEEL